MALWDNAACMELDRALAAQRIRYSAPTLGSTLGSPPGGNGHTDGSNHYPEWWGGPRGSTGQARDYGDRGSDCNRIAEFFEQFARGPNYIISELIWTRSKWPLSRNGIYYKRGVAYTPSFTLARQHNNHDHVAIAVGRHLPAWVFRGQGTTPQPVPPKPPILEDDDMSLFVQANSGGNPTGPVFELGAAGLSAVGGPETLADLHYLGHGRSTPPADANVKRFPNGVAVVMVSQRFIDELT